MDTGLIKNCTLVNPDGVFAADVYVNEDKYIEQIGKPRTLEVHEPKIIEGAGRYLIPAGIDPHVHLKLPTPAGPSCDDFNIGSFAAMMGGTGAIIDFVTPARGQSLIEALDEREDESIACVIPLKFHMGITWWNNAVAEEIRQCIEERGITSFKVYLAYRNTIGLDFIQLKEVMKCLAYYGAVLAVHAEEGDLIQELQNKFVIEGKLEPKFHAYSRPPETEYNAVKKIIDMVRETGCKTYFVHMSTAESVRLIREAKKEGLPIFAETCPQYLLLDKEVYERFFIEVFAYIISPPIRGAEDREELWKGLADGTIDCVSTDHCPFTLRQKMEGRFDFTKIPNGAGGLHYRMNLLFTHGVLQNRITMQQFVQLTSTNAARIFGFENYGYIKAGIPANLILWNPDYKDSISFKDSLTNADISIYDNFEILGHAEKILIQYA